MLSSCVSHVSKTNSKAIRNVNKFTVVFLTINVRHEILLHVYKFLFYMRSC